MSERDRWTDEDALHRHCFHAWEDFERLRSDPDHPKNNDLWHSLSHHIRHAAFRSGLAVPAHKRRGDVRRSGATS